LAQTETLLRVRYEETDQTGSVYHANYFRYFEVGRVEFLRRRGFSYREFERRGFRLPVVEARARFRAPARFDDLLAVRCDIARLRMTRIDLSYFICAREREDQVLAEGETVLACVGSDGRPVRLPDDLRAALTRGETS
jgi:acyl-CoA thioester hydrolase